MRNPEKRKNELRNKKNIDIVHLDVLDITSIKDAIKYTKKKYDKIDVLVNNAGYASFGPFEASTHQSVEKQFDTNVLGVMDVTREVLPIMREQKQGVIINVTSSAGRMTFPLYSLYNGTKWAVEGFSESLQFELRQFNIKIKIIEPGIIKTDFYDRSKDVLKIERLNEYDGIVKKMSVYEKNNMEKGNWSHPKVVAETIFKAATDDTWKLRYHTGKYAGTVLWLRRILPERAFLRVLRYTTLR
jgi:short-subunit dehydrogenase